MHTELSRKIWSRGFTLMELMVVVLIIGIMTAAILPEMKGTFEDALLRSTGREIINVFSLANSRAVSLNELCRVRLDPHSGKFLVEKKIQAGGRETFVPLKDVAGAEGKLDTRILVQVRDSSEQNADDATEVVSAGSAPDAISFYPDGTADAAEIWLRDRQGFQLALQLNPVTARVHVSEPVHE